ncbi:CGNR zinc finger domain-containing protein [Pseudophaeobacter arcticus]|jgi:predicted RNA-binding Zn ribbon-like protein|uniref:CGNR zinc finger domain-containing protein n=1 Tax=Pseudophaeobacter arcticus TaxID=385492 RepID=UPI00041A5F94|nr:CGNR zinc finger domain-containing protein [Pseudophaeobacter arcticus]|tara:strand:- start:11556 stop:12185 length:630 start_codon:yes stop_codon:yes gene_type:complete
MTEGTRPAPFFIGESPALDFLNSVAMPRSVRYDWLETGPDLLDWLVAARLASEVELAPFRAAAAAPALEQARQQIVAFRERLRPFVAQASDSGLSDARHPVIAEINEILARGARFLQIAPAPAAEPGGDRARPFILTDRHPLTAPRDLIVRIAAAAARLIAEADFHYVRNCEGPSCTLYFLDISKNHKRRWCSMEVCGNRAKAAAHRRR